MPIPMYLAMTAAEIRAGAPLPEKIAWLACHFAPGGTGLSNIPSVLPPKSLLILDDSNPIHGHDPERICRELQELVERMDCCGILLDWERAPTEESMGMVKKIAALHCPVGVPADYAADLCCSVFLPPVPPLATLQEYFQSWQGREIWLDCGASPLTVRVTENGSQRIPLAPDDIQKFPWYDEELHCHYRLDLNNDSAEFSLCRTADDLRQMLNAAEQFGVTHGIGLWQEFRA